MKSTNLLTFLRITIVILISCNSSPVFSQSNQWTGSNPSHYDIIGASGYAAPGAQLSIFSGYNGVGGTISLTPGYATSYTAGKILLNGQTVINNSLAATSFSTTGVISTGSLTSNGNLTLTGALYSSAFGGSITLGQAYSQGYPYGGGITISGGAGYQSGSVTINGGTGGNINGDINLNTTLDSYGTGKIRLNGVTVISNSLSTNTITTSGNAAIGTSTFRSGCALTVNGKIAAEEFEIVTDVGADYVFGKDYKLRSLKEVESYININSHLPEVPSAIEMQQNGYKVAEMNNTLLKKVEELTLYVIELNKQLEATKAELSQMKEGR